MTSEDILLGIVPQAIFFPQNVCLLSIPGTIILNEIKPVDHKPLLEYPTGL